MNKEVVYGSKQWKLQMLLFVCIGLLSAAYSIGITIYFCGEISKLRVELQHGLSAHEQRDRSEIDPHEQNLMHSTWSKSNSREPLTNTREKRHEDSDQEDLEGLLSKLSLVDLSLLRGPPGKDGADGKDGRDGRDGKDCAENSYLIKTLALILGKSDGSQLLEENGKESEDSSVLSAVKQNAKTLSAIHKEMESFRVVTEHSNYAGVSGTSYIRWGRTTCANTSQLLYEGFVGGQYYSHTGGASDRVCLPLDAEYSIYTIKQDSDNWMYGAEYEGVNHIFPNKQDQNIPCARCYTPSRSTTVMIPAKRSCPTGWTKEYEGYLMSEHYNHKHPVSYSCVDKDPEAVAGRPGNEGGALFYFVRANCLTTGHCPPYIQGAELTCIVCTK